MFWLQIVLHNVDCTLASSLIINNRFLLLINYYRWKKKLFKLIWKKGPFVELHFIQTNWIKLQNNITGIPLKK